MRAQQVGCLVLPSLNGRFYLLLEGNSLSGQALFFKISMSAKRATYSAKFGVISPTVIVPHTPNLRVQNVEFQTRILFGIIYIDIDLPFCLLIAFSFSIFSVFFYYRTLFTEKT